MSSNPYPEGGGLFKGASYKEIEEKRQANFEESAVKRILAIANVKYSLAAAQREAARITREFALSFAWFHNTYPGFPVRLGASKLAYMHQITVPDLFGAGFAKTKFFREYLKFSEVCAVDDREDRVGLVFNWPDISMMVLHNYPINQAVEADPDTRTERGTRIIRPFGNPPVLYVVESLADFMQNIGNDWVAD